MQSLLCRLQQKARLICGEPIIDWLLLHFILYFILTIRKQIWYNILVFRDIAQFGSALRLGHGTIQFASIQPNSHKPFNTATLRRLKKQNTCGQTSFDHMLSHRHGRYKTIEYFISGCSAVW